MPIGYFLLNWVLDDPIQLQKTNNWLKSISQKKKKKKSPLSEITIIMANVPGNQVLRDVPHRELTKVSNFNKKITNLLKLFIVLNHTYHD